MNTTPRPDQQFVYEPDCLLMFIDDTGHERLKGHVMYGLGGCAVLGRDYQSVIVDPWLRLRAATTGSSSTQLHAADFAGIATHDNMTAMNRFFAEQPFHRFAALGTRATTHPSDRELMAWVIDMLKQKRLLQIISRTAARSVAVIFEASDRADDLLAEYFGEFRLQENGQEIPVQQFFMPKRSGQPGLEVADFVINPAGRFVRHRYNGGEGFPLDFQAVFHRCDPALTSFMCIEEIEPPETPNNAPPP